MRHYNTIYVLALGAALAMMPSCSKNNPQGGQLYSAVIPSSVEFNLEESNERLVYTDATGSSCLPMLKGETLQLTYTMAPDDVTFKDVVWTASNPSFATVSDGGLVEAVDGDGYSIVQVAPVGLHEGSGINANLKIVVSKQMTKAESIIVSSPMDEIYAGDQLQMSAAIAPANSTYKTVIWSVGDESLASIDPRTGLLTGKEGPAIVNSVDVTATALDGSAVSASKTVRIRKIVAPQDVTIDQTYSSSNGYVCALNEKSLALSYTTVPAECTTSQIEWSTSDPAVATVEGGVVSFKSFGSVTITATTPASGKTSTIELNIPCGLFRETFRNPDYSSVTHGSPDAATSVRHDGYLEITTGAQNATKQRGDFKCVNLPVYVHAGNYPILAFKIEQLRDLYPELSAANLKPDIYGKTVNGEMEYRDFAGNGNNKYVDDLKCSDGSHVYIYDFTKQTFKAGLAPTDDAIACTIFQVKYADIATATSPLTYKLYWMQTFKSADEVRKYVEQVDKVTIE